MDVAAVMQAVANRLDTIVGLRVSAAPAPTLTPPAAVVAYPDTLTFDETYGRGMDRLTLPVLVVVGKVSDRTARDRLGAYCNGSGPSSVKQVLESGTYTAFQQLRVMSIEFDVIGLGTVDYLTARFDLDITGSGA